MQWKAKYTRADYQHGTTRLKRCFAWLPTYISGIMVWFETYEVLQMYQIKEHTVNVENEKTVFSSGKWINLSKRCR